MKLSGKKGTEQSKKKSVGKAKKASERNCHRVCSRFACSVSI